MDCKIKFNESKAYKALERRFGNNVIKLQSYIDEVSENGNFTEHFANWYQGETKKELNPNNGNGIAIANKIIQYYNSRHPNVDDTVKDTLVDTKLTAFGYETFLDRENGKKHIVDNILDIYRSIDLSKIKGNKLAYFTNKVKEEWRNRIFAIGSVKTGKSVEDLKKEYTEAEDKATYMENILGGQNIDTVENNLLAVYKEMHASPETSAEYFGFIYAHPNLASLRVDLKDELNDPNSILAANANIELEGINPDEPSSDIDPDMSVVQANNHLGAYTNFMMHIGERLRNYFNSLPKLNSSSKIGTEYDYDTNNRFGIAERMNDSQCSSIMYNQVNTNNIESMIASVRHIGETVPGFASFIKFADDLANDLDFAYEAWTTFAKTKMYKLETVVNDNKVSANISNPRVSKTSAFKFDLINDSRTSILEIDHEDVAQKLSNLKKKIEINIKNLKGKSNINLTDKQLEERYKELNKLYRTLLEELTYYVKLYYPSIDESAINAYALTNNAAGNNYEIILDNLKELLIDIDSTRTASLESKEQFYKTIEEAQAIKDHNEALQKHMDEGYWHDFSEFKEEISVWATDYVSQSQKNAIDNIVKKLAYYSDVSTNFNSRNALGNNSSDIINNNLLTKLVKMLEENYEETQTNKNGVKITVTRNKVLETWGAEKLRSKQYKYSNLLLEQKDDEGNIINRGIFKYINGQLCLTDYATEMLKFALYNGASNRITNTNMLYSSMVTGDYLPTSFVNFFRNDDVSNKISQLGYYFLRTPSDAPKTFCLRAPYYSANDLFTTEGNEELSNAVSEIVNDYKRIKTEDIKQYGNFTESIPISDEDLFSLITGKTTWVQTLNAVQKVNPKDKESNEVYVSFIRFNDKTERPDRAYIVKGNLEKVGKGNRLTNVEFIGVNSKDATKELPDYTKSLLSAYYTEKLITDNVTINGKTYNKIRQSVNRNSAIYKQLYNQFKQEMLDAAVALNHYFVTDEKGWVVKDKSNPTPIPMFKPGRSNTRGYKFYHLNKNGEVLTEVKKGKKIDKYELEGKVFGSNKFTLNVDRNGKIVHTNYMDDIFASDFTEENDGRIRFLYGGAGSNTYLHTIKDENGDVTDIEFTKEQEERIQNALDEFVLDYMDQSIKEISPYKKFIKDVTVNSNNIATYSFNHLLMLYSYDEILEGNSKFYLNAQTGLKRAKEYQGSGIPFAAVDYMEADSAPMRNIANSYLNTGSYTRVRQEIQVVDGKKKKVTIEEKVSIQDRFKGTILEGTTQRNKFTGVTIANTISTNVEALEELKEKLIQQGLSENAASEILYGKIQLNEKGKPDIDKETNQPKRKGGFTETKVNDAQSYITFQEWVRRVAAKGQLRKYMPLIDEILDESKPVSAATIKEFVQVQKNFYYDMHYDEEYGMYVPRQIKNAEFVLIPRFIKGTQLEKIYDLMVEAGIDQLNTVETSKAANETILKLWDNNGDLINTDTFVRDAKQHSQLYSYAYLYSQQETPQHMNAENKAGIQLLKKILDNIPFTSDLYEYKQEFFKLFAANIRESYDELMDELEITRDENGNIIYDENGNISINKKVLYDKLKDELVRLGNDVGNLDYVTLDEFGNPLMPSYINTFATKFESVVQSLFNNFITRQKLPGFHAAQVTNVGWKPLFEGESTYINKKDKSISITKEEYDNLSEEDKKNYINSKVSYSKKLKYHPNGKGYIEVMLPLSTFGIDRNSAHYKNMTDEEILKELADKGLDMVIGYRIPTEGKQSICNMKVVGFIDDALGSTIIVPDDWVSQTGSDFDIDSVYGIQYTTYTDAFGEIHKIEFINNVEDKDIFTWFNYINKHLDKADKIDTKVSDKIEGTIEHYDDLISEIREELQQIEEEYYEDFLNIFGKENKKVIRSRWKQMADSVKKQNPDLKGNALYSAQIKEYLLNLKAFYDANVSKLSEDNVQKIERLGQALTDIDEFINGRLKQLKDKKHSKIQEILLARKNDFEAKAKEKNLYSFDEFKRLSVKNAHKINNRKARNNRIVKIMMDILADPNALEENLSRSNFDDAIFNRDATINDNVKDERDNRSFYNIFDQIRFQEDAMSGAKLKAFSVTLDTFCSVCNTVRPTLEKPIYVVYDVNNFENPEESLSRFSKDKFEEGSKSFAIRHNTYGWSSDNRNVEGKLITAYSSQTTAHILDAIKEGPIPNVNDYTFAVYKTFLNVGSDFRTAISFIMQPGIKRIVDEYNANNSIYEKAYGNPIHKAIKSIAKELGIKSDNNTSVIEVLAAINKRYGKEFNKIFKQEGDSEIIIGLKDKDIENLPIIQSALYDRLKERGKYSSNSPVERKLLFDLGVILSFNKLHKTANDIGNIARCCNPDKFGAKQTIYATDKVFDDAIDIMYKVENNVKEEKSPILSKHGRHILASIYPGIENGANGVLQSNEEDSSYPTLFAFLKYTTATSSVLAKHIFDTQHPSFKHIVKGLTTVMSGYKAQMTEALYNDFQKFVLSAYYNKILSITKPIIFTKTKDGFNISIDMEGETNDERQRVHGFGQLPSLKIVHKTTKGDRTKYLHKSVIIKDLTDPTEDEIKQFAKFSPAQKVQYIKTYFDNPGIFGLLNVNLINVGGRSTKFGAQTIQFFENNISLNVVRNEFLKAFYNTNPLVAMAAYDLIKYAVLVEGLNMKATGITKILHNKPLYEDFGNGTGFVQQLNNLVLTQGTNANEFITEEAIKDLYEKYLRSKVNFEGIRTLRLNKANIEKYKLKPVSYNIYYLTPERDKTGEVNRKAFEAKMVSAGIATNLELTNEVSYNSYIRLVNGNKNILYKINKVGDDVILYPLPNLEENETFEWSANPKNNEGFTHKTFYETLIKDYADKINNTIFNAEYVKSIHNIFKEAGTSKDLRFKKPREYKFERLAKQEELQKDINTEPALIQARDKMLNYFSDIENRGKVLYLNSAPLSKYVFESKKGEDYSAHIKLKDKDGITQHVKIFKVNASNASKKYLEKREDVSQIKNDTLKKIFKDAQNVEGLTNISTLVGVTLYDDDNVMAATLEEANAATLDFALTKKRSVGDPISVAMLENFKQKGINNTEVSLKTNAETVTREAANYAIKLSQELKTTFDFFIEDPLVADTYISITDDRIQTLLEGNNALIDKYLRTINNASAFLDNFAKYSQLKSNDAQIQFYIDKLHAAVEMVQKLPIDEAQMKFAQGYVTKLTTNPLIKTDLINVMDGYWKTYGSMWKFHDIMENGNPLLQTILKDVMGDLDAKRMHTQRILKNHRAKIKSIVDEAKRHGLTVDFNKFIDDEGRFKQDYAKEFVDKLYELREAKDKAIAKYGLGSIEHLRAKLEYDTFKAYHINQEAKPEYYQKRVAYEKIALDNIPDLYSKYMKLYFKELEIYSEIDELGLSPERKKELADIQSAIYNLYRDNIYYNENGQFVSRPIFELDANYTPEEKENMRLYSVQSAATLKDFIGRIQALNETYFEYDSIFGFEEQLKRNLAIVRSYEKLDANGIPTVPQNVLESDAKYLEAKNWIRNNAKFVIKEFENDEDSIGVQLRKALKRLSLGGNAKINKANELAKEKDLFDENGVVDATKLTEADINSIRKIQEATYKTSFYPRGTDRILISNAKPSTEIYTKFFYDSISGKTVNESAEYFAKITQLNEILEKYYTNADGYIHFDMILDTKEGINELKQIALLYQELRAIKAYNSSGSTAAQKKFIEENVEFVSNTELYKNNYITAQTKSKEWKDAWLLVNLELNEDGSFKVTDEGKYVPNRFLYSYIKPKGEPGDPNYDKFVDKQRSKDVALVEKYYRRVGTKYYYNAMDEALTRDKTEEGYYQKWFLANHVYNPYKRRYEPLDCWVKTEIRYELFEDDSYEARWEPKSSQKVRKVRDGMIDGIYVDNMDMRNEHYDPNLGLIDNYIQGSKDGIYDRKIDLNKYEIEMRDYLYKTLLATARNNKDTERYFKKGYLPVRAMNTNSVAKRTISEASKMFGFNISLDNGKKAWYDEIGYDTDTMPMMPMTQLLKKHGESRDYKKELGDRPVKLDTETQEDYEARVEEYETKYNEIKEHNRKVHNSLLDKNWEAVIEEYLLQAGRYNAVQDNKMKLYYLLDMLRKQQVYSREYGAFGNLKQDDRRSTDENTVYTTSIDKDLIEQYENFIRRILFDQWKESENKLTKFGNNLQGFTSANYMMMNIKGGIANVNLGETQIFAEAIAKEFLGAKDWGFGTSEWTKGAIGFAQGMYKDTAVNKQDAIRKHFKVVDYDEVTGVSREVELEKYSKRLRDAMFSPQTITEDFMQNSVLFGMLHSHKIVAYADDPTGIGFTYMNKAEYVNYRQAELLTDILSEEQMEAFGKFKAKVKNNKDEVKEYAWFRRDLLTDFVYLHCSEEQARKFITARKKQRETLEREFDALEDMYSQCELGSDGYLTFREGSMLAELDKFNGENNVTKAEALLGRFAERVRKVNNKIHGVYNKMGAAYIERKWYGSIIMQYHKHLPFGLMKRYRNRGFFSEFRGTVEKGIAQSYYDFLSLNFRKLQADGKITQGELGALESLQNIFMNIGDYIMQLGMTWNMLPEYDKANIRRSLGDIAGCLAAIAATIALLCLGDDDDDSILYNLALYEADRLASEAFLYNPLGMISETKKLMSTPIAAQSIITDIFSSMINISHAIIQGDEWESTYQSGRFAGEYKLAVYLERRIPIWNGIRGILDIPENNHYYKVGDNAVTLVPTKDIANWIKE